MKTNGNGHLRCIFAHIVLIVLSFMRLLFFCILLISATRSHADLQKDFPALPRKSFFENLNRVANNGMLPMLRGVINSLSVSSCNATLCTYFSALAVYGLYACDPELEKAASASIMVILIMLVQVTTMGFSGLIIKMGMYDPLLPLVIPSIASSAVFYSMFSYMKSSLPLSLVEAARTGKPGEFKTFNRIVPPIMELAIAVQAIFTPIGSWNNYLVPALVTQLKDKITVPILTATLYGVDYVSFNIGEIYMMILVAIIPIILVYLFLSKYIITDVTLGGVEG